MTITADRLTDYLMDRVHRSEQARIERRLASDPASRRILRRVRATAELLGRHCGEPGNEVPPEWLRLLDVPPGPIALVPMSNEDRARDRAKTWL